MVGNILAFIDASPRILDDAGGGVATETVGHGNSRAGRLFTSQFFASLSDFDLSFPAIALERNMKQQRSDVLWREDDVEIQTI